MRYRVVKGDLSWGEWSVTTGDTFTDSDVPAVINLRMLERAGRIRPIRRRRTKPTTDDETPDETVEEDE